ncbi:matrin-3-like isoform X2 [Erpetoichthys calabaricus]|uniref:matrin-3-like isoform X2 n=1 Tax=Erpetoichthys calabaricus TaxID=27687 RepID=UPI002234E288|nr:matrin-3-like isoform X2 [Erpetoichthys calabaricus]
MSYWNKSVDRVQREIYDGFNARSNTYSSRPSISPPSRPRPQRFDHQSAPGFNRRDAQTSYSEDSSPHTSDYTSFTGLPRANESRFAVESHDHSVQDRTVANAMDILNSFGLSAEDLNALARVPEDLLNVDSLPELIMELRSHRTEAEHASPSPRNDRPYRVSQDTWEETNRNRTRDPNSTTSSYGRVIDYKYGRGKEEYTRSRVRHDFEATMEEGSNHYYPKYSRDYYSPECEWTDPGSDRERSYVEEPSYQAGQRYDEEDPGHPTLDRWQKPQHVRSTNSVSGNMGSPYEEEFMEYSHARPHHNWRTEDIYTRDDRPHARDNRPLESAMTTSKVIEINGLIKAKDLQKDLEKLAAPFGTINKCAVFRKRDRAFLEMSTQDEATAMINYYKYKKPSIRGQVVQLSLLQGKDSIQEFFDSMLYIRDLPPQGYSNSDLWNLVRRAGLVDCQIYQRNKNEAFVEVKNSAEAEKMIKFYRSNNLLVRGKKVNITICKDPERLTFWRQGYTHQSTQQRDAGSTGNTEPEYAHNLMGDDSGIGKGLGTVVGNISFEEPSNQNIFQNEELADEQNTFLEFPCVQREEGFGFNVENEEQIEEVEMELEDGSNDSWHSEGKMCHKRSSDHIEASLEDPNYSETLKDVPAKKMCDFNKSEGIEPPETVSDNFNAEKVNESFKRSQNDIQEPDDSLLGLRKDSTDVKEKVENGIFSVKPIENQVCNTTQIEENLKNKFEEQTENILERQQARGNLSADVGTAVVKMSLKKDAKFNVTVGQDKQIELQLDEKMITKGNVVKKQEAEDIKKSPVKQTPLEPYQPNTCYGLEFMVPATGYFCKLCNLFYCTEQSKLAHCKTQPHYQKLKNKIDKESSCPTAEN